jgi:glycosyltransferase involved in cell wall biosynthesis
VVTSTTGSSPEVAGGAAVLVNPFDVQDMTRGLESVLYDEVFRQELIAKGCARASHFKFQRCARETLGIIEQLDK